jgi:hypothetical protein
METIRLWPCAGWLAGSDVQARAQLTHGGLVANEWRSRCVQLLLYRSKSGSHGAHVTFHLASS